MTDNFTRPCPEALYYHIAADSLNAAQAETDDFRRAQHVAAVLVFSALCLEAYANQRLEDLGYPELEDLSFESKWKSLPKLAGSQHRFDESRMPYQGLRELIRLRNNRLVHYHADEEILREGNKPKQPYHSDIFQDLKLAERALRTVVDMITELRAMAGIREKTPDFLGGARFTSYVVATRTATLEALQSVSSRSGGDAV